MTIALAELITFEAAHPRFTGAKQVLIRRTFTCSAARYYQQLNNILTTENLLTQALEQDPVTTRRLLRQRDERAATRDTRKVTAS